MLEAYSLNKTINTNDIIPFTSVSLVKGSTATLTGSGTIQLNKCGVYMIQSVITGTPAAAGSAKIEVYKDGVVQPQATVTDPAVLTTVGVTLPIVTLIQVTENNTCCCCTKPTIVQLIDAGVGLTSANAKIVVTKIC